MADFIFAHETRYSTKSKAWKVLEMVILLKNITNLFDGSCIIILFPSCMQWSLIADLSIRCCEVNGNWQRHLPAWPEVVNEIRIFDHLEVGQLQYACKGLSPYVLKRELLIITKFGHGRDCGADDLLIDEDVKFDWKVLVGVAQLLQLEFDFLELDRRSTVSLLTAEAPRELGKVWNLCAHNFVDGLAVEGAEWDARWCLGV